MVMASGCREISLSRLFFGAVWPVADGTAAAARDASAVLRSIGWGIVLEPEPSYATVRLAPDRL